MKEIREDLNKYTVCLPKLIEMFIAIPTTISARIFFLDTGKIILKFIWKYMGPKTTNTILRKNIVGGIILSNFNSYIAMITVTVVLAEG